MACCGWSAKRAITALLGGGLDRGTSSLILGPAGCGKTTLCAQYSLAALNRGEAVASFLFEEGQEGFLQRAAGLGMDFQQFVASGIMELQEINPAELSPGEFASRVCDAVERRHARLVIIDSLNGYMNAMPSERFLLIQMHELLRYLSRKASSPCS